VPAPRQEADPAGAGAPGTSAAGPGGWLLAQLDADQRAAVLAASPLMIVAGPGTGKTRTLTYRMAYQLAVSGLPAGGCLAITFTRRAAQEMGSRLSTLAGPGDPGGLAAVTVTTFHGLGLKILRELHARAGLPADFQVADEATRQEIAAELGGPASAGPDREALVKELTARGLVDFDGLIDLPAGLLAAEPALAAALRERWRVISVDEYQDIDAAQYELLRLLAGDGAGLTAIGDPDQAIYGFRGADVGFFMRFGADYQGSATRRLGTSYRSSRPIVAAAMAAIAPATLVPGRTLQALTAGSPVTAFEAGDEHAEAAWISRSIDQLLGGASFHSLDSGRADSDGHAGLSLADIAVLYRTDAQSGVLGQALTRSGLPFRKGSHDLLQRHTGVPQILAELRLAGPAGPGQPVADLLAAAVRRLADRLGGQHAVDIRAAGEVLAPLARRCDRDLERFGTEVSLGATLDAMDPRADAVTLLTMHAAKGLEFEVVFIAGCEDGLLPLRLPGRSDGRRRASDPAEERRLLFVGMTRARSRLLISYAAARARHGSGAAAGASPFLRSIGPALLERPGGPRLRRPAHRQLRLL
jgi:superfamily I DNA/RNA helicase